MLTRPDVAATTDHQAQVLASSCGHLDAAALLRRVISHELAGRIALVSSFGSESALLLDMVARINPTGPVLFLNTGKLFGETLRYRDELVARLRLTDVREIGPRRDEIEPVDADGMLWSSDPDLCCYLRKVAPLHQALERVRRVDHRAQALSERGARATLADRGGRGADQDQPASRLGP